jgi:hypothetical protein
LRRNLYAKLALGFHTRDLGLKFALLIIITYTISKSKMISRRQAEDDEVYFTYVEEADNDANKDSALI